jgi:hypothetical protein
VSNERQQFIITGCPRSGTLYITQVFTELGIACEHETLFSIDHVIDTFPKIKYVHALKSWKASKPDITICGEVSWLAVPFLDLIDPSITILHQVREPIACVKSLYGRGFFLENRPGVRKRFTKFANDHLKTNKFENEIDRCFAFWTWWNKAAEKYARLTYKVETTKENPTHLMNITNLVGYARTQEEIESVLTKVKTNVHLGTWKKDYRVEIVDKVGWDYIANQDLRKEAYDLAIKYGYEY